MRELLDTFRTCFPTSAETVENVSCEVSAVSATRGTGRCGKQMGWGHVKTGLWQRIRNIVDDEVKTMGKTIWSCFDT